MPRNSMEYTRRRAEDDEGAEHQQEKANWAKEDHAYDVLRHILERDRETARELVNIRSRVADNGYPAVSWMDQDQQGGNEPRQRIWEAYQQTKEDHDPEQNEYAARELADTLTHRAERTVRDFIDPELNRPWSHNDRLDSAVKDAVKHQTMMHPWGVEDTNLMEHLQAEIARGLQDSNRARFEDAIAQMHELEKTWQSAKSWDSEVWDRIQKENLETGYAFLNRLGEKDPDLLRELDGTASGFGAGREASWLRKEGTETVQKLLEAFREATDTFPIEKRGHIASDLASTIQYPVWKEIRGLTNRHAGPEEFTGDEPLATIPDREGLREMILLAAEDLYYGLRTYKNDLMDSILEHQDQRSQTAVENITGVLKETHNLASGWRPDQFHTSATIYKYGELEIQRKELLVTEYELHLQKMKNESPEQEPQFSDFAKDLINSDIWRLASAVASNAATSADQNDTLAADRTTEAELRNVLVAAARNRKAQEATE